MASPFPPPSCPPSYYPFPPSCPSFDGVDEFAPLPSYPSFDGVDEFAPPPSYPSFDGVDEFAPPPSYPSFDGLDEFALPPSYPSFDGVDTGAKNLSIEDYGYGGDNFLSSLDGAYGVDRTTSLPPGVKFRPTDEELVINYLQLEFLGVPSAPRGFIIHADIYDYEPHQLSGLVEQDHGDGKMYFYTRIKKIGKSKTDRSIKSKKGFWKPSQAPKPIRGRSGNTIGYKTSLAYFEDKKKTQWLMQEYRLQSHTSHPSSQELVLAVVYFFSRKSRDDDDDDNGY